MNRNETLIYACILTLLCGFSLAPASSKGAKDTPHGVSIKGMQFVPDKLEINVGDTVVWTNRDDRDHNVTAKDGSFKSDNLGHGETFSYKFRKAGNFSYSCTYHPRMKAIVVVSD